MRMLEMTPSIPPGVRVCPPASSVSCTSLWPHSRPRSGEEWPWADFNHAGPKGSRHPSCSGTPLPRWQANLGMVTRSAPRGEPLSDTEACSQAFHRQGHPRRSMGQVGLPGTSPALTTGPKDTTSSNPNPSPTGQGAEPWPKGPQAQF